VRSSTSSTVARVSHCLPGLPLMDNGLSHPSAPYLDRSPTIHWTLLSLCVFTPPWCLSCFADSDCKRSLQVPRIGTLAYVLLFGHFRRVPEARCPRLVLVFTPCSIFGLSCGLATDGVEPLIILWGLPLGGLDGFFCSPLRVLKSFK